MTDIKAIDNQIAAIFNQLENCCTEVLEDNWIDCLLSKIDEKELELTRLADNGFLNEQQLLQHIKQVEQDVNRMVAIQQQHKTKLVKLNNTQNQISLYVSIDING